MVGYAGSPTRDGYVDVTMTRSKVKVTGLLNFRQLAKPCILAAMTTAPLRGFLVSSFRSTIRLVSLWPPCVADVDVIFLSCGYFFFFFPCLISGVADWMFSIHMVWP